ncbi:AAA family ATPase [Acinetobacter vivianii]|uniref:ATP-dependent nuclease n=1 Tax=Acinetobacter vivianii TaxID=1776742 RepID=UPI002DBB393A|nr:AAA family ATPase [Acinetobacter vivianii]MEB6668562.1 AAA family ATPase [Acinetobacter vivianii]
MLHVKIENLKSIENLDISLPFEKGLFAISGENGIGKSTLFSVFSKLVYRGALSSYFSKSGNSSTRITFELNGCKNIWTKNPNWQRLENEHAEIFINGFYEGSLIYGKRFSDANKDLLKKLSRIKNSQNDLIYADEFVKLNLGKILKNKDDFYKDLKIFKYKKIAEKYGFKNAPYFWVKNEELIPHMSMSSGEYLLIGLLHFINERIKYMEKRNINDLNLILLDEIELALHPAAQDRLASFLKDIARKYNFCIYFATHSIQIINNIPVNCIYHVEQLFNGKLKIVNPCYPAYATRNMYMADGFDYILLVEDMLAKSIVEKTVKNIKTNTNKLIKILPCGGWEKTLELHQEFKTSGLAGGSCKIISILDGDIKDECDNRYKKGTKEFDLIKLFLPIFSVEKYIKEMLIVNFDEDFFNTLSSNFYTTRSLNNILEDYQGKEKAKNGKNLDNNGKILLSVLQACSVDQGRENSVFLNDLISIIMSHCDCSKFEDSILRVLK